MVAAITCMPLYGKLSEGPHRGFPAFDATRFDSSSETSGGGSAAAVGAGHPADSADACVDAGGSLLPPKQGPSVSVSRSVLPDLQGGYQWTVTFFEARYD